jgi:uncharacterized protein YraI
MKFITFVRNLLVAAALISGATSLPALAQGVSGGNAVATSNVNVRQGPGTSYSVVDVLRQGDAVSIRRCTNGWCQIDHAGRTGWASRQFLQDVGNRPGNNRPGSNISININIGTGGGAAINRGRACFFEQVNFRGRSFCARAGESDRNLGSWDNRISSIRIEGRNTRVDVCTERNFGNCSTFAGNVPVLNRMLQQNVSSFRVR